MADKQSKLSIVIGASNKTSAGFQSVLRDAKSLESSVGGHFKMISDKLASIGKATGFTAVLGAAGAVASAIKSAFSTISETLSQVVSGVLSLVSHFDDMGDKAEKLDITVDFLQAMRFAAERSGSSIETLDQGLSSFAENMGQLRGGTGRMLASLQKWAPTLVPMLKATHGNEAAFRLLADAMSKITDPQKRLALAMKTVGNSDLAPMLARGSAGLFELQGESIGLTGSLEEAARAGGLVDDELKRLKASGDGFKGALMRGVAPALLKLIPLMTKWLSGHREQITEWIVNFGEKLPGAIDKVVSGIETARDWVSGIVDDLGGWDAIAKVLGGALRGQFATTLTLLSASLDQIAVSVKVMKAAFDASPVGLIIANWSKLGDFFEGMGITIDRIGGAVRHLIDMLNLLPGIKLNGDGSGGMGGIDKVITRRALGPDGASGRDAGRDLRGLAPFNPSQQAKVIVEFKNAPQGTRAKTDPRSTADVDTTMGYQLSYYGGM